MLLNSIDYFRKRFNIRYKSFDLQSDNFKIKLTILALQKLLI